MTAEAAVLNKSGIALAADSKATLRIKGIPKSHDAANKLFTLSKYHPVGIMINGNAEFMKMPWETVIKIYRDKLKAKSLPVLEEYADDFIFSLTKDYVHSEKSQTENLQFIVQEYLEKIRSLCQKFLKEKGETADKAVLRALAIFERQYLRSDDLDCLAGITEQNVLDSYGEVIKGFILARLPTPLEQSLIDRAQSSVAKALLKANFSEGLSEVIVAGFGNDEMYPSLQSWEVDGVMCGRLRCKINKASKIDGEGQDAVIIPFAQREMVDRFMMGIDPDYRDYLNATFSKILNQTASDLIYKYGKGTKKQKAVIVQEVESVLNATMIEHRKTIQDYAFSTYAQPIIDMTQALPKDELAHLAESLVNLTSFKRRVSLDAESVGGDIDVAVISKGDGFIWIKRKHYFEIERNGHFVTNYLKPHDPQPGETAHERHQTNE